MSESRAHAHVFTIQEAIAALNRTIELGNENLETLLTKHF